jgi:hypothetical protein
MYEHKTGDRERPKLANSFDVFFMMQRLGTVINRFGRISHSKKKLIYSEK